MLERSNRLVLQSRSSLLGLLFAGLSLTAACSEAEGESRATLSEPPAPIANSGLENAVEPSSTTTSSGAQPPSASAPSAANSTVDAGTDDSTPAALRDEQTAVTAQGESTSASTSDAALEASAPDASAPDAESPSYEDASVDATIPDAEPPCSTWYADCDGDGYAPVGAATSVSCTTPASQNGCGWTSRAPEAGASDCEDTSAAHHPRANYGLMISGTGGGLETLSCWPDGTYKPNNSLRCVVTTNPDLNCDGKLEPQPKGAAFLISGGHYIADLTHACASDSDTDCGCWLKPAVSCGVTYGVSAYLCPRKGFGGDTTLLCR